MARPRRHRSRLRPEAGINLTPLMDTCFNLLIAFILIAPALKHGLNVELAKVDGGEPLTPEEPVSIVIAYEPGDEEPRFYLDNERVTLETLRARLEARHNLQPPGRETMSVLIEPAAKAPTEATLQVLGIVIDLGIRNYGFVTEPRQSAVTPETP